jgi:hypothetical protein
MGFNILKLRWSSKYQSGRISMKKEEGIYCRKSPLVFGKKMDISISLLASTINCRL